MFKGRSAVESMVLIFTVTVCFAILATGATVAIIEIRDPRVDTSQIVQSLLSIVSGILGALLGLMAGKTLELHNRPDGTPDDVGKQP